ncbi:MerR family transcriptional regulator [Actinospica sp. MGRD01-02]|uniref:MerR family transcriptional regulator n=1 Tax=Actinospica acidithermotolerans TaxID=2828514 RepID=A0A941E9T9_9ACTN|nr:MerR family transcriptional regulator [Actinospica acidithermotolerans]MBR7828890.1 MerR family transcriptional regulator [Actinospica acidithermotolerans]
MTSLRISELSATSGVPLPTVKYYLREGLLPAGERTARNQAEYGPEHLARLRLIRALIEVGRLSVADTRAVLAASDDPRMPLNEVLGAAHDAVTRRAAPTRPEPAWHEARAVVLDMARQRGWHIEPDCPALDQAADAVAAVLAADIPELYPLIDVYFDVVEPMARREVEAVLAMESPDQVVRGVVMGTILGESLFNALRLLAQQSVSTRLLDPGKGADGGGSGAETGA